MNPTITSDIFKLFLIYIYSGKVPLLATDVICGLYHLSDLYEVTSLKKKLRCYPNESVSRTVVKVDRKSFSWSIKDFDNIKPNQQFHGPAFSSGTLPFSDLQFVAHIEESSCNEYDVRICICRLNPDKACPVYVKCKFMVMNFTGETKYSCVADHLFKDKAEWKLPSFIKMKKTNDKGIYCLENGHMLCLKGKSFLLNVEFFISGKELTTEMLGTGSFLKAHSVIAHSSDDVKNLSIDLGKLYNIFLPRVSDVVLHIGDVRFPAHMVVLSARSPVFSRMFEHEMLERKKETVLITDIDVATLNMMLTYIYSGKVDMILNYDSALKLYAASDKYDIASLKEKCTSILKKKLTDADVCSLLIHADMHSDAGLKSHAKNYICKKSDVVLRLPEWKELLNDRPDLATEIIQELMTVILHHKESCIQCSKNNSFF